MCGVSGRNRWRRLAPCPSPILQQARVLHLVFYRLRHHPVSAPQQPPSVPRARPLLCLQISRRRFLQMQLRRALTGNSRPNLLLNMTILSSSSLDGLHQVSILLHLRLTTKRVGRRSARRLRHLRMESARKIGDMSGNHRRVTGRERVRLCQLNGSVHLSHLRFLFVLRVQFPTSMSHALTRRR